MPANKAIIIAGDEMNRLVCLIRSFQSPATGKRNCNRYPFQIYCDDRQFHRQKELSQRIFCDNSFYLLAPSHFQILTKSCKEDRALYCIF